MTSPSATVEALWSPAVFAPVPVRNAFEMTVERLASAIRLGVLGDGEQLPPERQLAELFGVSRVTLREAIRALREVGLVASRRGRGGGNFVRSPGATARPATARPGESGPSTAALRDAIAMRRVVEPGAAELAATRSLSAAERTTLRECLAGATGCSDAHRRLADTRLHMAVAACTGSPTLADAVARVQLRLDALLRAIPVLPANIAHSDEQHADVVRAVLAGDAAGARSAMLEHVDGTAALLTGLLA